MTATITQPWGVSAYGSAEAAAEPDVAYATLGAERTENDAATAFAATRALVDAIRAALVGAGVDDSRVHSSRLTLATDYEGYGAERRFLGYRCEAVFSVEITDLDRLEAALVAATEAGANRVDAVNFGVRDRASLEAVARREAVAAARRRAELYAEAAGVRLGAVLHVEDLDGGAPVVVGYRKEAMAADAGGGAGLRPGRVSVSASVAVGFGIVR